MCLSFGGEAQEKGTPLTGALWPTYITSIIGRPGTAGADPRPAHLDDSLPAVPPP